MKLKFYINKEENKIYTLKKEISNQETKDAHYKFVKFTEDPNKEHHNN